MSYCSCFFNFCRYVHTFPQFPLHSTLRTFRKPIHNAKKKCVCVSISPESTASDLWHRQKSDNNNYSSNGESITATSIVITKNLIFSCNMQRALWHANNTRQTAAFPLLPLSCTLSLSLSSTTAAQAATIHSRLVTWLPNAIANGTRTKIMTVICSFCCCCCRCSDYCIEWSDSRIADAAVYWHCCSYWPVDLCRWYLAWQHPLQHADSRFHATIARPATNTHTHTLGWIINQTHIHATTTTAIVYVM